MTLNLNRAGVICTWSFWWRVLLWFAGAMFALNYNRAYSSGDIIIFCIILLLIMFSIIRGEPTSVTLGWNSVKYRDRVQIGRHSHEDVLFTLSGVTSVSICQNPIERLFGMGHMVIKCTVQMESSRRDLPDRRKHAFYGITEVERLCDEIGSYFPTEVVHIKIFGMAR
ncbi:MAG: PH domain-containing protein [Clostridia bacterium]|nr:PH domain-containing protein [Clostridia bacterium]